MPINNHGDLAMATNVVLFAFGLSLFAGLSTGIGSLLALIMKKTSPRFLSVALGFSAGFMIYVSFAELLQDAKSTLISGYGSYKGAWYTVIAFFCGILMIAIIDRLVPSVENPHEARRIETAELSCNQNKLMRLGFFTALVIAIHNFPEGIATFMSGFHNYSVGIAIALAVAIHNIPEGIAVSIPIYCATGSRRKAFRWSFLSGLCEPLGALIGYVILFPFINEQMLAIIYAVIAGIMVFVSLDELLPSAREYGSPHLAIYGLIGGMLIMAVSLLLIVK